MVARKGSNSTYVKSGPFNFDSFQDLLYCTFINEIAKGLPSTLVGRLDPESRR